MAQHGSAFDQIAATIQQAGASGLCLFFFLSSFLITELLLLERGTTGTIRLKAFYIRRTLRIWPLYYLAVAIGIAVGLFVPMFHLSLTQCLYLLCFFGWMGAHFAGNPMSLLWSISFEELFYVIWPSLLKFGGKAWMCAVACGLILCGLLYAGHPNQWYSPILQFMYFSAGSLTAMGLHERKYRPHLAIRAALLLIGCTLWYLVGNGFFFLHGFAHADAIHFGAIAAACTALFLAIYNVPAHWSPKFLVALGRISYGLYIFHLCAYYLVEYVFHIASSGTRRSEVLIVYTCTFALTWAAASLSFRFYETPFLKLKRRFEFVQHAKA